MHHFFGPHFGGPHFLGGPGFLGIPGFVWLVLAGVLVWYLAIRRKSAEQSAGQNASQQSSSVLGKDAFAASDIGTLRGEIAELRRENEELRRTIKTALERFNKEV